MKRWLVTLGACCLALTAERAGAQDGFAFGSYGRVHAASDLRGHSGENTNIVAHGTRYDLGNYVELELRRGDRPAGLELRTVATLALAGDFFHYDGDFDDPVAVRNLYVSVKHALFDELSLWAGSRMVRGDDVYLLDFWPLDNLNMIGGGASLELESVELAAHAGMARPNDPFYVQRLDVVAPLGFEPTTIELLDRPRGVAAAKATWWALGRTNPRGLKLIGYGEAHHVAAGTSRDVDDSYDVLPAASGGVLGAQLGGYWDEPQAFSNLFLRCAFGLAAYDWLSGPELIGRRPATSDASDCQVALSANVELGDVALQAGAYFRRMRDPSTSARTGGAADEGAIDVRPYAWAGEHAGVAVDVSYQALQTRTLDDVTGKLVQGSLLKAAVIPFYSPFGRGTYTRPHLQLTYAVTLRDEGARRLYPELDRRSQTSLEHFLAIGAEWWFDSTSY